MSRFCFATFLIGLVSIPAHRTAYCEQTTALPSWIWHTDQRAAGQVAHFQKHFAIDRPITSAVIRSAGESVQLTVAINEQLICKIEPYDPLIQVDVSETLRSKSNVLSVTATSVPGPCAFFLLLEITLDDGSRITIGSEPTWEASSNGIRSDVQSFGLVDERFVIPHTQQVGISTTDNYEQWKQALGTEQGTDPASFWIADGFQVQHVRSAKPDEDSWVSLAFDPQGRAIIAKEKKGLLRITLSPNGDQVTQTENIVDSLKECRGILPLGRDIYLNANNSKALYRVTSNAQGVLGDPYLIYGSAGGVGHGRNDLALGPDGKIYSIHGDSVAFPRWATDHTSPFRQARRGKKTSEGHLLRIDPRSGSVEVLAAGLRNPFGIDFNKHGDVFTYDADAEYDMGAPWYRPTRINHLVTGGDYGWRGVTKSWPPYYPDHVDNALPNLDIGKGSPTAVKFGTRSNFPDRYRQALFILDWAYGRIIAVHAMARGASYVMTAESFLKGRPLNVTDLDFGPDGSMYFVTGGRQTKSALYRVQFTGQANDTQPSTQQSKARVVFAKQSRQVRRELEAALLREPSEDQLDHLWSYLGDSDPWIAHAAINAIERHPIHLWSDRALQETSVVTAVRSLTALARSDREHLRPAIIRSLNQLKIENSSRRVKQHALHAYSLCLHDRSTTPRPLIHATTRKLTAMYPDESFAVNQLISELLANLGSELLVGKTIPMLRRTNDQTERMHYLYVLRNIDFGWTTKYRRDYFDALNQSRHYVGGAGMPDFLRKIRSEAIETLTEKEQAELGDVINQRGLDSEAAPEPRPFVRKWTVDSIMRLDRTPHTYDASVGQKMFAAASCSRCHRFGGRGTLIGPDLTSVSRRFSRRDLVESMVNPSRVIAENYRSLQIATTDGRILVGQTALGGDYRSPVLKLANDPSQPLKSIEIPKVEIESQKFSTVSWMPEGLLDTLTGEEILNLIGYLEAGEGESKEPDLLHR